MNPHFDQQLYYVLILFTLIALVGSVIPSFLSATKRSIVEVIHEEWNKIRYYYKNKN